MKPNKNKEDLLLHSELLRILSYDPVSGIFTWKIRQAYRSHIGEEAGGINKSKGYRAIMLFGKPFLTHRLAWFYVTGNWPIDQIDHINGVKDDNRLINLREADYFTNRQNVQSSQRNNTSSTIPGVWRNNSRENYWCYSIRINGKRITKYAKSQQEAEAKCIELRRLHYPGNML